MPRRNALGESWRQSVLVPPDVLEIRLRLGFIRPSHHGRWQLEVIDPSGNELLAMESMPHFAISEWEDRLGDLGSRIRLLVESYLDPDPFP